DAKALGAEPSEPAEQKLRPLLRGDVAPSRNEGAPMLLDELHAAISPAVALPLVSGEVRRQQTPAIAPASIVGPPTAREQGEPEIGILDDGVARPAAGIGERAAAYEAHGAMRDDGVDLVPLHHADIEEAGIFAVHHRMHHARVAITVILRRLHEPDARGGKGRDEILEPIRMHDIVGVEHADDLGFRRSMVEREPERAGFEALELIGTHEFEAWSEELAVFLDGAPEVCLGRVVDDHDAFEIGPIEL